MTEGWGGGPFYDEQAHEEPAATRIIRPIDEQRVREIISEVLSRKPYIGAGCVCPPLSERTCQGPMCPRKRIAL